MAYFSSSVTIILFISIYYLPWLTGPLLPGFSETSPDTIIRRWLKQNSHVFTVVFHHGLVRDNNYYMCYECTVPPPFTLVDGTPFTACFTAQVTFTRLLLNHPHYFSNLSLYLSPIFSLHEFPIYWQVSFPPIIIIYFWSLSNPFSLSCFASFLPSAL